ncbi:UDP-glucose iridoid glucosyltransferase-like [Diospyros lotus]|uniref:UDP-glucose iridoid glucosyltransferase-like n=1 Tax=Diospyros lotus TaxID=55363 RepID=UPI002254B41A|nr:UDP-glucose iridoid glucosyltransferase-like [Diospyros lotus]
MMENPNPNPNPNQNQNQARRRLVCRSVVLVPCPFQGHVSPMLELGSVLHSKGFSITIAHCEEINPPNPSNHPDFAFLPFRLSGDDHQDIFSGGVEALFTSLNARSESPLKECLAHHLKMMPDQKEGRISCIVVYDALMYTGEAAATQLKLPSLILRTSDASALLAYGAMARLQAAGYSDNFPDSKLRDPVPQLHPLRFKDLPTSKHQTLESLVRMVSLVCIKRTSSAIIWNTLDWLEQPAMAKLQQQDQIPFFSVGPLFKLAVPRCPTNLMEEDAGCISWLDKQNPQSVLYISFGSLDFIDERELAEMATGLANSGQPFLWAIRPGSVLGSQWIEPLPPGFVEEIGERGRIVKWAPQREVLAHSAIGGFWSHCGWNSTLESISEGVPLMCSPRFGDQKVSARYISYVWKVGLELETEVMDRKEIERVIRRLMVDKEGKEIRERAAALKEKVELSIKAGGSSYNALNALTEFILSL